MSKKASELLGEEDPTTVEAKSNLASVYRLQTRFNESEALCREALEIARRNRRDTTYQAL